MEVATLTATHAGPFAGLEPTGRPVRLVVIIHFPWDPDARLFTGERIYLDRAQFAGSAPPAPARAVPGGATGYALGMHPAAAPDAVVVGSGPNGLSAAITLARAGRSVAVYEAADEPGGGCRTAELTLPGYQHDVCSAIHPTALASPFFRSLDLAARGVEFIHPDVPSRPSDRRRSGRHPPPLGRGDGGRPGRRWTRLATGLRTDRAGSRSDHPRAPRPDRPLGPAIRSRWRGSGCPPSARRPGSPGRASRPTRLRASSRGWPATRRCRSTRSSARPSAWRSGCSVTRSAGRWSRAAAASWPRRSWKSSGRSAARSSRTGGSRASTSCPRPRP